MASRVSSVSAACAARREAEIREISRAQAAGRRTLGYTCLAFPAAIAAGLGLRPLRVLCGATPDAVNAGEKTVRPDACALVRSLLGNVREGRGLHGRVDAWIGLSTCDQMRRGWEAVAGDLGREVHQLQVPATRGPSAAGYYAARIRRLVGDLEASRGVRFDADEASRWQGEQDRAAAVLSRAARSGARSPLEIHRLFHLFFVARPHGLAEFLEETIAAATPFSSRQTVMLAGSPGALEDTALLELLEEREIAVIPAGCTGLSAVEETGEADPAEDAVERLALRSFFRPACMRARPNNTVFERLAQTARDTGAAGLIVKCLTFCDTWYTERERLRRTLEVPVLVVDSGFEPGSRERLSTRVDAFLEGLPR